jgi:opacity protein-like surface antigen
MFRTMLAVVMFALCGTAVADNYVGVGTGKLRLEDSGFKADDTAVKLFGGWRFNQNFALELGYLHGGSPEDGGVEVEPRAMQVSVLGALPLTDSASVYARAGVLSWKSEAVIPDVATIKTDGEDFAWGVGTSFNVGSRGMVRLEYEGADLDGADIALITLGGVLRFGAD